MVGRSIHLIYLSWRGLCASCTSSRFASQSPNPREGPSPSNGIKTRGFDPVRRWPFQRDKTLGGQARNSTDKAQASSPGPFPLCGPVGSWSPQKPPPGHVRPATHADRRSLNHKGPGSPAVCPSALRVARRSDRTQRNCHLPQAGRWAECRRSRRARNVRGRRLVVTAPASSCEATAAVVSGFYRRRRASTRPGVGLHGNSNNETIPRARHHFIHAKFRNARF